MLTNTDFTLELYSVFHTGQVEPGTCFQKLIGSVRTGVILKDVSLEAHGGEVMAILGSKGSGKRALLEVIARRAQGPTRGQIILNNVAMSMKLFQKSCSYVTQKCDLMPGLTVQQTLEFASRLTLGSQVSSHLKRSRVKQVMADLALTQIANRSVQKLTHSEYRRLMVGVQIVRDPVVLLLDEPTWELDPLNTYFLISILSNHAKKYNRIVVLTMEKPRSDIFPFLDRVTYLCLGDIVYTGSTRMMLDYFRNIGFPCPELENPLMYYLCLSTVDRRSRERFIESNNQIAALVEKFKQDGLQFRKYADPSLDMDHVETRTQMPLTAFGKPNCFIVLWNLIMRAYVLTFNCRATGVQHVSVRLLLLPFYFFILWIFFYGMQGGYQRTFITRNGLIFSCLAGVYFLSIGITASLFGVHRTRYYQEAREGLYSGPLFLISHILYSVPLSGASIASAAAIIYFGLYHLHDGSDVEFNFLLFWAILWACYIFAEQQTMSIMMIVKSSYTAAICSIYLTIICIVLGSSTVRTMTGLPDWLYYLSYIVQPRYAGAFLNEQEFMDKLYSLPARNESTGRDSVCQSNNDGYGCRYLNGTHYLEERYHIQDPTHDEDLNFWFNFGITFAFCGGITFANLILCLIPLPAFVKTKFRE